ncbi:MAG: hypothetical protein VXW31_03500 [Planctomycetota bacterium]|nr:hypothetical protein [Planctomycetota bacterium]
MSPSTCPSRTLPESEPASASGHVRLGHSDRSASRVDLVWRDPLTGARLALDLEVGPALLASLRDAGFEVQAVPPDGPEATQAA